MFDILTHIECQRIEPLSADSPVLQFSPHFTFGPTSCDSSLASTDIPFSDDGKGIPGIR